MTNRLFSQAEEQKHREIPYRTHGVWGYCARRHEEEVNESAQEQYYGVLRLNVARVLTESITTIVTPSEAAAKIERNLRIAELERRIAALEQANRELRAEVRRIHDGPAARQQIDSEDPRLSDVVAMTEEMFGTPEINVLCDPEDPETQFVVFTVRCSGEAKDIVTRRIEWHDRVDAIPPGRSGRFRLSIVPLR